MKFIVLTALFATAQAAFNATATGSCAAALLTVTSDMGDLTSLVIQATEDCATFNDDCDTDVDELETLSSQTLKDCADASASCGAESEQCADDLQSVIDHASKAAGYIEDALAECDSITSILSCGKDLYDASSQYNDAMDAINRANKDCNPV